RREAEARLDDVVRTDEDIEPPLALDKGGGAMVIRLAELLGATDEHPPPHMQGHEQPAALVGGQLRVEVLCRVERERFLLPAASDTVVAQRELDLAPLFEFAAQLPCAPLPREVALRRKRL